MRVAYLAESPADQTALTILTEAILGKATVTVIHQGLRSRGWPEVKSVLRAVLKELHYHTDAEGFVLCVDSDYSPPHLAEHEQPNGSEPKCRLCQLRQIATEVEQQVRPRQNLARLNTAFGLAVPTIEAWLLAGINPRVTEAAWINGLLEGREPFTKESLKHALYGTSRPSLAIETEVMKREATRLASNLPSIESLFPQGFGALLRSLKSW